ncbi:TPA: fimbrial biogenesis outer membrane usher protein [Escherichia coli]|nr:fimbrial biogenesis outer membrane usher protein [Escherichia coli]
MTVSLKKSLLLVRFALLFPAFSWANLPSVTDNDEWFFDHNFLRLSDGDNAENIDLSYFTRASGAVPGKYTVDVTVNGELVDKQVDIYFSGINNKLKAKLTTKQLYDWGIDVDKISSSITSRQHDGDILIFIQDAEEYFDINNQKLILNIPQSYIKPKGWLNTPPKLWESGVPALMVNYQFNGVNQTGDGYASRSQFLSLNNSLNIGGWRLRHNGNWSKNSNTKNSHWQPVSVYLQRDYSFMQGGQFTIGQTSTDGMIFDSFPFNGIQFSSDDGMIAPELSRYSPVVRGIAYSQAQVTVKQNDTIIYQKNVPPGPFELRDFSQMYSGDLQIEIRESDGTIRHYTQASAILPILQREGRLRYNLAMGEYRSSSSNNISEPKFIQSSIAIGLPSEYTLYGGGVKADNYYAIMFGMGKYSDFFGALSLDISHARSQLSGSEVGGKDKGQSYRFMYSRGFGETNTTLNITGYRYASKGYYSFDEFQQIQSGLFYNEMPKFYHQRSGLSTTLSHEVDNLGQINLSASKNEYWNYTDGYDFSATYSPPFRYISAVLSLKYSKSPYYNNTDKSMFLSLSVPFNSFDEGRVYLTTNTITNNGQSQQQIGLNGASRSGEISYSINQGWNNQGKGAPRNINLSYRAPYAQMSGGFYRQNNSSQWTYAIGGGITLHPEGVTLSQPLSLDNANALVQARDAAGVKVLNGTGIYTDWRGYAVVPYLTAYKRNVISLDVNSVKENVELLNTDVTVIPSKGSLVPASFKVNVGNRAIITLFQKNGLPVPFGSVVSLDSESGVNSNIVAEEGQVYMSGLPEKGTLIAKWGDTPDQQCVTEYAVKERNSEINNITLTCH